MPGPFTFSGRARSFATWTPQLWARLTVFVITLATTAWFFYRRSHDEESLGEDWYAAARTLGLTLSDGEAFSRFIAKEKGITLLMTGVLDGFHVRVEHRDPQQAGRSRERLGTVPGGYGTRITVASGGRFPALLSLAHAPWPLHEEERRIGDPVFDGLVEAGDLEADSLACLGDSARSAVAALVAAGAEVRGGNVTLSTTQDIGQPDTMVNRVRTMVAGAQALAASGSLSDLPAALARNAQRDSMPAVRQRNLAMLVRSYRDTKETAAALSAALRDDDARVRLTAAAAVGGEEGSAAILALATDAGRLTDDAAAQLAEALRTLGARGEPALVQLLARESTAVRAAAAKALGEAGTVASVERLLPLTEGLLGGAVKDAATRAIRQIQERLGPVDEGRLSLVEPLDVGGLSIAPPGGEVSLVPAGIREPVKK